MYLLEETPEAEAMRENVRDLLKSADYENFKLSMQLIEGGGLHESFYECKLHEQAQWDLLNDHFKDIVGKKVDERHISGFYKFPFLRWIDVDIIFSFYSFENCDIYSIFLFVDEIFRKSRINQFCLSFEKYNKYMNPKKLTEVIFRESTNKYEYQHTFDIVDIRMGRYIEVFLERKKTPHQDIIQKIQISQAELEHSKRLFLMPNIKDAPTTGELPKK